MPLIQSSTVKALRANIAELIRSGRKPKQAYAIALDNQKEAKKKGK